MRSFAMMLLISLVLLPLAALHADSLAISTHVYGPYSRQSLSLQRPAGGGAAPLILFVHGGGWSAGARAMGEGGQGAHFAARGWAWASVGYRLVPGATVEQQAGDIAAALAWLARNAGKLGLDPARVVLVGHSSGAQLAALVGTDPGWAKTAEFDFTAIRAVVSIDGAGLDLDAMWAATGGKGPFYDTAFGPDAARWHALSPVTHAAAPNAPRWLLAFDRAHNGVGGWFAQRLAAGLRAAGSSVDLAPIDGTSHMGMLRNLGRADDALTERLDAFLADQSGQGPSVPRM